MIYSSLQVKFEGTKPNGRIQRYGASIVGDIIIKVSKSIDKEKQVFWSLQYIARFDVPSVLIASRTSSIMTLYQKHTMTPQVTPHIEKHWTTCLLY